jgi:hypothetical protein
VLEAGFSEGARPWVPRTLARTMSLAARPESSTSSSDYRESDSGYDLGKVEFYH